MQDYLKANRANWNDRVSAHLEDREYYDVEGFLAGNSALQDIEVELAGDVKDKKLLHLMCHFGLDTLAWARKGADVTGVDFSPKAIEAARDLAKRANLNARFVEADANNVADALNEQFDIVVMCYGVVAWLPDMDVLMSQVSRLLKPGGRFVLVELHPVLTILEPDEKTGKFHINESYFAQEQPQECDWPHSYTNRQAKLEHTLSYQWNHGIAEILTACLNNGVRIDNVGEYPYLYFNLFPGHLVRDGRRWVLKNDAIEIPMLLSVRGTKTLF